MKTKEKKAAMNPQLPGACLPDNELVKLVKEAEKGPFMTLEEHHEKMMKRHEEKMMHHKDMMKEAMKKDGKKGDMKLHEMAEKRHEKKEHKSKDMPKAKAKVEKVMHEFKEGELHSGSKKGPQVTNPKQAIAIAMSEARRVSKKRK